MRIPTTFAVAATLLVLSIQSLAVGAAQLSFVRWQHPSGLFGTEVPAGWTIDGALGDAMDQGQFRVNATSPDGRSHISIGHNWLSFMEIQSGRYQPGAATVERFVLPPFVRDQGYVASRVVYRSANSRLSMPGVVAPIPFDRGTITFLLRRADGRYSVGSAMGETNYIASPGTPGLWRLRLFAAAVAPADARAQADVRAALVRATERLDLSPEFFRQWNEAFASSVRQMREYSAQMDRVFSNYLRSAAGSSGGGARDTNEDWATMMRGGQYGENPDTEESYWITNDHQYWYVNDRNEVIGNDTGQPPATGDNWKALVPRGQ